jgi:hypothetical protein
MSFSNFLQESVNDKGTFKCLFITSSPLAGKSYTLSKVKGGSFPAKIVNTDIATEFLAKKYNISETDAYKIIGGKKIKGMTMESLYHTLNGVLPLIVDGTSADQMNLLKRKGIVEGLGYDTAMIFVDVTLDTVINRLRKVQRGEDPNRKRAVDEDFMVDAWHKTKNLKPFYQSQFKEFHTIKANDGDLTDRVILQSFNKLQKFFGGPKNELAQMNIDKMRENGEAYLVPSVLEESKLKNLIKGWYSN